MLPELAEIKIASLSHDGRGIGVIQGKTTFVHGALPQEQVQCKIIKKHSRYNEAQTTSIIAPAAIRVNPKCAHFGICGGCSMQHVEANAQLHLKQQILLEQLKHFGQVTPEHILPAISSHPWGYRRKARLGVRYVRKKEKLLVGFREKLSNYLADIEQCPVLHPSVGTHLIALRELIQKLSQYEHIPQIEIAVSDEATALVFRHMGALTEKDIAILIEFGKTTNFHIYLQPNAPEKTSKLWPSDSNERLRYFLPDYQLEMHFHPLDFTQINSDINRLMINQALALLEPHPHDIILDLFCGLGNFTLPLARHAEHVIGVEGSIEMVERAKENARMNQLTNTEFYAANLMEPNNQASWLQKTYHKILLDPPRSGAKEVIPFIAKCSAKKIVYVSCNPATLARDAKELVHQHQYLLKKIGIINMFPHTSHIEAIALFEKNTI